jgi:hypothetical protein
MKNNHFRYTIANFKLANTPNIQKDILFIASTYFMESGIKLEDAIDYRNLHVNIIKLNQYNGRKYQIVYLVSENPKYYFDFKMNGLGTVLYDNSLNNVKHGIGLRIIGISYEHFFMKINEKINESPISKII